MVFHPFSLGSAVLGAWGKEATALRHLEGSEQHLLSMGRERSYYLTTDAVVLVHAS